MQRILLCLALSTWLCLGCSSRMGHLGLVSSKSLAIPADPARREAVGRDCVYRLLGFVPLGRSVPDLEKAADRALANVPDVDLITNAAVHREAFPLTVVVRDCLTVTGELGNLP